VKKLAERTWHHGLCLPGMTTAHEARRILLACRSCMGRIAIRRVWWVGVTMIEARNECELRVGGWRMDENERKVKFQEPGS
jgi:hypothetical protein